MQHRFLLHLLAGFSLRLAFVHFCCFHSLRLSFFSRFLSSVLLSPNHRIVRALSLSLLHFFSQSYPHSTPASLSLSLLSPPPAGRRLSTKKNNVTRQQYRTVGGGIDRHTAMAHAMWNAEFPFVFPLRLTVTRECKLRPAPVHSVQQMTAPHMRRQHSKQVKSTWCSLK